LRWSRLCAAISSPPFALARMNAPRMTAYACSCSAAIRRGNPASSPSARGIVAPRIGRARDDDMLHGRPHTLIRLHLWARPLAFHASRLAMSEQAHQRPHTRLHRGPWVLGVALRRRTRAQRRLKLQITQPKDHQASGRDCQRSPRFRRAHLLHIRIRELERRSQQFNAPIPSERGEGWSARPHLPRRLIPPAVGDRKSLTVGPVGIDHPLRRGCPPVRGAMTRPEGTLSHVLRSIKSRVQWLPVTPPSPAPPPSKATVMMLDVTTS
jgi:hypothetical protein